MTNDFEQQYAEVRKKENRMYSDSEVLQLPKIRPSHNYSNEWQIRERSARRLVTHLEKKKTTLRILEIGCGNGWLSFQMSAIRNSSVIGLDINTDEVRQAQRVFNRENLKFMHGEFNGNIFKGGKFDCIVFAASIQYFPLLQQTLNDCLTLLATDGEVHIIDTYFYTSAECQRAATRTAKYYSSIGFPEMAENYFHHTYGDLRDFKYRVVFNPFDLLKSVISRQRQFSWIVVKA
jgi:ubiquinone/menaquinone biosynthesis C-methylase UbiE